MPQDPELTETSLTVKKTVDAPIDRVWAAFTDPEQIAAWYHPGSMTTEVEAWEPTEGGKLDITMVAPPEMELEEDDPGRYRHVGTFHEVRAPERLVHTWQWANGPDEAEGLVTVEFHEVEEGTEIVLTHEKLADRQSVEYYAEGWVACLESLEQTI